MGNMKQKESRAKCLRFQIQASEKLGTDKSPDGRDKGGEITSLDPKREKKRSNFTGWIVWESCDQKTYSAWGWRGKEEIRISKKEEIFCIKDRRFDCTNKKTASATPAIGGYPLYSDEGRHEMAVRTWRKRKGRRSYSDGTVSIG